jgi:quercetin dioxygenase-like cupin family protein
VSIRPQLVPRLLSIRHHEPDKPDRDEHGHPAKRSLSLRPSAETGGVRVVAKSTLTPGGSVTPHSHRVTEIFECLDGSFITHLAGTETEFKPGQRMIVEQHKMHGFRNDTAQPATLKVPAAPAGELDPILRALSGLSHDGLLVPGKPPQPALAMASLAWRSRYYQPPLQRSEWPGPPAIPSSTGPLRWRSNRCFMGANIICQNSGAFEPSPAF